jgi:hypothetical protein
MPELFACPCTREIAKKASMVNKYLIQLFCAKLKQKQTKKPCRVEHDFFE